MAAVFGICFLVRGNPKKTRIIKSSEFCVEDVVSTTVFFCCHFLLSSISINYEKTISIIYEKMRLVGGVLKPLDQLRLDQSAAGFSLFSLLCKIV